MGGCVRSIASKAGIAGDHGGPLAAIRRERRLLGELIISAVALALAANLVSQWVSDTVGHTASLIVGIGALAIVLAAVWLTRSRKGDEAFEGYVLVAESRSRPVAVPRYRMAEEVARRICLSAEAHPDIERRWQEHPDEILREAVETFALSQLSAVSEQVFPRTGEDRGVEVIGRPGLRETTADNEVLDRLTNPELLPPIDMGDFEGELVALVTGGGTTFERLTVTLPRGSTL